MSHLEHLLLISAATIAAILNSVAGGGSFLTLPALMVVGVPAVAANATSAVVLWPAQLAGAFAYRAELAESRGRLTYLAVASAAGGLCGALLLLRTSNDTFVRLLPFLLLAASLVFTFGGRLAKALGASQRNAFSAVVVLQLFISVYGGYFGGGMGIVMLAAFSLMGMTNIHAMNALKTVLATLINLVAIVLFITAGTVAWRAGAAMMVAASLGGYFGASWARKIDPLWVKRFVLFVAWTLTGYFFVKTYVI